MQRRCLAVRQPATQFRHRRMLNGRQSSSGSADRIRRSQAWTPVRKPAQTRLPSLRPRRAFCAPAGGTRQLSPSGRRPWPISPTRRCSNLRSPPRCRFSADMQMLWRPIAPSSKMDKLQPCCACCRPRCPRTEKCDLGAWHSCTRSRA